ncbi:hypothetical protein [Thauera phenylacetica]|jgi:hypothetical protein|uniref:Lipoprotein n=1 Tax=Thauera phenylacetica B4P TaxID=1234382 RepID=N6YVT6_9RHOO|nr:hypothetical protein [Thauera phenylacetica]ENO95690.1 hypothetical protein C667_17711 [Thauera phenylacetica B4P]MBP7641345.1 hypothetical protein [Thauera sp.]HRM70027.1 hypothetical protein [Thauera phenylacetica]
MPRPTPSRSLRHLVLVALLPFAAGCDQLAELLELPNPSKVEAEGRAVGSACRHAGRSLEDCYSLNPAAAKAAVFAGWRDMNDYMMEHKLEVVPSQLVPGTPPAGAARTTPAGTPAAAAAH